MRLRGRRGHGRAHGYGPREMRMAQGRGQKTLTRREVRRPAKCREGSRPGAHRQALQGRHKGR
eukprot:5264952-Pleurochrysis_carterae.AAC.1